MQVHRVLASSRPSQKERRAGGPQDITVGNAPAFFALYLLAHALLVVAMRFAPAFATLHALIIGALAVAIAAFRPIRDVSCALAYLTGAEVLWRMTRAGVPHEYGKYMVALVCFIALLRLRGRRNAGAAIGYFLLLLPSAVLTIMSLSVDDARQQLSFNLSGPLSLTLCVVFFSNVKLTIVDIRRTFFALMGPVFAIALLTYFSIASVRDLEFTTTSNVLTSGGFGPNQVSATLGLGLLAVVLLLFDKALPWRTRAPMIALAAIFAIQAALTFSRGGIFIALASSSAAALYLVREQRSRITLLVLVGIFFVIADIFVVPQLEQFTQGKLGERYSSVDPSGRGKLANYDLQIFEDAPLLGVGPGMGLELRKEMGHYGVAHTEFTRMLAEHGILGIAALAFLCLLGIRGLWAARSLESRAFVVAMLVWFTLYLAVNAMRTVAPSFAFGLIFAVGTANLTSQRRERSDA